MRCPKCGFNSFDHNLTCPKCRKDLSVIRRQLNLTMPIPGPVNFFQTAEQRGIFPEPVLGQDQVMEAPGDPFSAPPFAGYAAGAAVGAATTMPGYMPGAGNAYPGSEAMIAPMIDDILPAEDDDSIEDIAPIDDYDDISPIIAEPAAPQSRAQAYPAQPQFVAQAPNYPAPPHIRAPVPASP